MIFTSENDFENALVEALKKYGWDDKDGVLMHPTEQDLLDNWAAILLENNRGIDKLNDIPLTPSEMQQIIEQITELRTPAKLNGFINGKTVSIKRDNPADTLHFGKEVSLKIYDRREIAAGNSRYQIARQPHFKAGSHILPERRGDLLLLINGMPVIHLELKRSGVTVKQAIDQIAKYQHEGIFSGLLSLVQIFVAMTPEETRYFANPGNGNKFDADYQFQWADFNNEPINDWQQIAASLLSIPMAHQLIGFYTIADDSDGALKVMRSYQYYAANAISDKVAKTKWGEDGCYGGFIWHTTGSGKTMTSFKSAQLIANSKDADKVVFLMDRIELGTQSLQEYRSFAEESESVQETEDTQVLKGKLKSNNPTDTLIVTSIQKMSRIREESGMSSHDIETINKKRLVFIVDECHRSTFGEMLSNIKETFPNAIFFGFTGTPIHEENRKKDSTTSMVFGDELHRYSIADGIRDKNVLPFDPYMVLTFKDKDVRREVALDKAKAETPAEAMEDPNKSRVYYYYLHEAPMAAEVDVDEKRIKGVEDYIPKSQYKTSEHKLAVVRDICDNWLDLSRNGKFHAIFATSSIPEAIEYYRLLKEEAPELKVTALFDPNIDNNETAIYKEDGLIEIIEDYSKRYDKPYTLSEHYKMKKDIAERLAHKKTYLGIERTPEKQIDILIVVDQMLTGFDSKWINTLYMDKLMTYENVIQAFSRTNRLFGFEKPHGTIRYYRKPHTMRKNVEEAVRLYSGDRPLALFVSKLNENLLAMNRIFEEISAIFRANGAANFESLPEGPASRAKFANTFREFNERLEAAKIQGFTWDNLSYEFDLGDESATKELVEVAIDEQTYLTLALRYKELSASRPADPPGGFVADDIPYDLEGHLVEIDTGRIDSEYMNANFTKWLKALTQDNVSLDELEQLRHELHRSFASLTKEEQKFANIFLHDVESGNITLNPDMSLRDYITQYQHNAEAERFDALIDALGIDSGVLSDIMCAQVTEENINEYGRLDKLADSADRELAKKFFESREGRPFKPFEISIGIDKLLREFILSGGKLEL